MLNRLTDAAPIAYQADFRLACSFPPLDPHNTHTFHHGSPYAMQKRKEAEMASPSRRRLALALSLCACGSSATPSGARSSFVDILSREAYPSSAG
jgi:hypothetical protein